jgi:hypothetical protein
MGVMLGGYVFDAARIAVAEKYEEVGGRDARVIEIRGVVEAATPAAVEVALDAILAAASNGDERTALSLRSGRRLWVRRTGFMREVSAGAGTGSYLLTLEARDPFEESVGETLSTWVITASGQTNALPTSGTAETRPQIAFRASNALMSFQFSDGLRAIAFAGTVGTMSEVVVDPDAGWVTIDGLDVTPYTTGEFPCIAPGGGSLCITYGSDLDVTVTASLRYRDRWW